MEPERMWLVSRLERYLASNAITQSEFADQSGVSQSTVSRILSGSAEGLRRTTIARLERVLGTHRGMPHQTRVEEPSDRSDRPRILRVFVATPSDVEEEVDTVRGVVDELNRMDHAFRLEVVSWRSHAIPGPGSDPQSVINVTMPDAYDVFVGIMWARFGTPTSRAGSGTEEEFEKAFALVGTPSAPAILFYFKDEPIRPSSMDPEQLASVHRFKARLAEKNLYWDFKSRDELAQSLRVHLGRTARRLMAREVPLVTAGPVDEPDADEDFGFLDLVEEVAECFLRGNVAVQRMTADTKDLGSKMTARTAEMEALPSRHGNPNVRAARRIADNTAADMNAFAERLEAEIPIMGEAYGNGFDAATKAIDLFMDFAPEDTTDLLVLRTNVANLLEVLVKVIDQQGTLRTAVVRLPRLTKSMAKARRRTLAAVEEVTTRWEGLRSMASVVLRLLDETIAQIEEGHAVSEGRGRGSPSR